MRTIDFKISYEKMISRLPGLFAYLNSDEFGNVSLYKATESIDGCYAKLVENIKLPNDCTCHVPYYREVYSTPCYIDYNNPIDVLTLYEYQKTVHQDFADDTEDDDNNETIEDDELIGYIPEYTYYDIPRIIDEETYNNLDEEEKPYYTKLYLDTRDNSTYITNEEYQDLCLKGGETYTFRTLISFYYEYKNVLPIDNVFTKFIERGIGKIRVGDTSFLETENDSEERKTQLENYKDLVTFELVPEFVYLSNVRNLYNQMVKLSKQCALYYEKTSEDREKDKHLCCLCEKFERMGGNLFKDYLNELIPLSEEIANEYYDYADTEKSMNLDLTVDLVSSYEDMGIMTPYAPQWIPYKRYYVGDKVVYNGELYICITENNGAWSEDYQTVVFDNGEDRYWELYQGAFVNMEIEETYDCTDENRECIKTTTLNYTPIEHLEEGQEWYDGSAIKHVARSYDVDSSVNNYKILETTPSNNPYQIIVTGMTDTKLVKLRRFANYLNRDNVNETPTGDYDWLFYYRKGKVLNIRTLNDNLGNIKSLDTNEAAKNGTDNLAAYGDFIADIEYQTDSNTIVFTYYIGVHLQSKDLQAPTPKIDDDGNKLYLWDEFEWDRNENIGIKYREAHTYDIGSDLEKLINGEFKRIKNGEEVSITFEEYIDGKYDIALQNYKFEFNRQESSFRYNKDIANQQTNITSYLTSFVLNRDNYTEFAEAELFREDYLNGITYNPTRDINVKIERGSTSCFDKHIALSECKTLEDLENYKNGSFFTINES